MSGSNVFRPRMCNGAASCSNSPRAQCQPSSSGRHLHHEQPCPLQGKWNQNCHCWRCQNEARCRHLHLKCPHLPTGRATHRWMMQGCSRRREKLRRLKMLARQSRKHSTRRQHPSRGSCRRPNRSSRPRSGSCPPSAQRQGTTEMEQEKGGRGELG